MAYPTQTDYVFEVGADPTSVFPTDEATLLLSFGRLMTTNEYHGIVIHSETTPSTSGQPSGYPTDWFAWNKRSLWHNPATNEVFGYHTGLGWEPIPVGDNTVDTDQIVDGAVTPEKLAVTGSAYQLLQLNATATAWTLVDPNQIFPAASVPVDKLERGNGFVYSDGAMVFYHELDPSDINNALGDGNLVWTTIAVGDALQIFRTNAAGTLTEWVSVVDAIQNGSVTVTKLSPGTGNANKVATVSADGLSVGWVAPATVPTAKVSRSGSITIPAATATTTAFAHGLGAEPTGVEARFYCVTLNNGYAVGSWIQHYAVEASVAANDEQQAYTMNGTVTELTLTATAGSNLSFLSKTNGTTVTFNPAEWVLVWVATLIA
jgi:hypothetical protein